MNTVNIKTAMIQKGYKNYELAEKLGVSNVTISRWINGAITPPLDKLIKLADVLEVSVDYLVGRE